MNDSTHKSRGNQPLTTEQIGDLVRQLEPHLKGGYSIRKACDLAEIPKSTVYDLMQRDSGFADKINTAQSFLADLTSSILATELMTIKAKQVDEQNLSKADRSFVQWFAKNHFSTQELFGDKPTKAYDPEVEIQRIAAIIDGSLED